MLPLTKYKFTDLHTSGNRYKKIHKQLKIPSSPDLVFCSLVLLTFYQMQDAYNFFFLSFICSVYLEPHDVWPLCLITRWLKADNIQFLQDIDSFIYKTFTKPFFYTFHSIWIHHQGWKISSERCSQVEYSISVISSINFMTDFITDEIKLVSFSCKKVSKYHLLLIILYRWLYRWYYWVYAGLLKLSSIPFKTFSVYVWLVHCGL